MNSEMLAYPYQLICGNREPIRYPHLDYKTQTVGKVAGYIFWRHPTILK
jgi:hypothetical protein